MASGLAMPLPAISVVREDRHGHGAMGSGVYDMLAPARWE